MVLILLAVLCNLNNLIPKLRQKKTVTLKEDVFLEAESKLDVYHKW